MGILSGIVDAFDPSGKSAWEFVGNIGENAAEIGKGLVDLGRYATQNPGDIDDIALNLVGWGDRDSAILADYKDRYLEGDLGQELYDRPAEFLLDIAGGLGTGVGLAKGTSLAGKGLTKAGLAVGSRYPGAASAIAETVGRFNPALVAAGDAAEAAGGALSAVTLPLGRKGRDVTVGGLNDYIQKLFSRGRPGYSYGQADPPRAIRQNDDGTAYFQDTPMRAFHSRGKGHQVVYPGMPDGRQDAFNFAFEETAKLRPRDFDDANADLLVPGSEAFNQYWDWLLSERPDALRHKQVMDALGERLSPEGLTRVYQPTIHDAGKFAHEQSEVGTYGLLDPAQAERAMTNIDQIDPSVPTMNIFDVPNRHLMALGPDPNSPEVQFLAPANLWTPEGLPNIKGILDVARDPAQAPLLRKLMEARRLDGEFRAEKMAELAQGPLPDAGGLGFFREAEVSGNHVVSPQGSPPLLGNIEQLRYLLGAGPRPQRAGHFHGAQRAQAQVSPPSDVPDPFMILDDADLAQHLADVARKLDNPWGDSIPPAIAKERLAAYMQQAVAAGRIDPEHAPSIARAAADIIEPTWIDETANVGLPINRGKVEAIPGPEHAGWMDHALAAARSQNLGGPYNVPDEVLRADDIEVLLDAEGVMGGKHRITLPDGRRFFYKPGQDQLNAGGGATAEIMAQLGDVARPGLATPVRRFNREDFLDERLQDPLRSNPGRHFFGDDMARNPDATVQPWIEGAEDVFSFLKRGGVITPAMWQQMLETTPLNALSGSWDIQGGNYMVRYVGPGQGPGGGDYALIPIDLDLALSPFAMRKTPIEEVATGAMTPEEGWERLGHMDDRQQTGMIVPGHVMHDGHGGQFNLNRINPDDINPTPVYEAADKLVSFGGDAVYDLARTAFSRSPNPQSQLRGEEVAQMLRDRLPYLTDYIGNLMKGRPDHVGVAFRERGAADPALLAGLLGGGVAAGIGLSYLYGMLTGDEPGGVTREQKAVVFDFLRDGSTPDDLFDAYRDGHIPMNSKPFQQAIETVEAMDDNEFAALMAPYAQEEGLDLDEMMDRKRNLREYFASMVEDMKMAKAEKTGIFADPGVTEDIVDPETGAIVRQVRPNDFPQLDPEGLVGPRDLSGTDPNQKWGDEQMGDVTANMPEQPLEAMKYLLGQEIPKRHAMTMLRQKFPTMATNRLELFFDKVRKGEM